MGYACSVGMGAGTMHFTASASMPINHCTSSVYGTSAGTESAAGASSSDGMLHLAFQAPTTGERQKTAGRVYRLSQHGLGVRRYLLNVWILLLPPTGYVGLGFASGNVMANSDVVFGYVDGSGNAVVRL